jgi:YHS domain-containing protein
MIRLLLYLFDVVASLMLARMLTQTLQQRGGTQRTHQRRWRAGPADSSARGPDGAIRGEMARDPVCGIFVSTELSKKSKEAGQTLHFCSPECRDRYRREHGRVE